MAIYIYNIHLTYYTILANIIIGGVNMSKKRIIPKEILVNLYVKRELSITDVGKELSASNRTVRRNLKDNGIHIKTNAEIHTKHNMSKSRQYRIWFAMRSRCDNKKQPNYQQYGAKNISYPKKWKTFKGFWEDMHIGYSDNKTLDRINGIMSYSKANCGWIDYRGQNRNKSDNVLITYKGETKTIAEWAKEVNISQSTLYSRKSIGWSDEEIIGEKSLGRNQYSNR